MEQPALLFIAGIPASGKSHFGRWLEAEHQYLHIDAEVPGDLERHHLRHAWNCAVATQDCARLAAALVSLQRPAVFNWGFPIAYLPVVAALRRAGFEAWWFNASVVRARAAHVAAGRSGEAFDTQVRAIRSVESQIKGVFERNRITVLNSAGVRLRPATILARIRRAV